jgi:glutaredoxin
MIDTCPHCQEQLNLSDTQKAKVQKALDKLPAGDLLKLGCPHCQKTFELLHNGTVPGQPSPGNEEASAPAQDISRLKGARKVEIAPPPPPDIGWLASGKMQDQEIIEDTPMALILIDKGSALKTVREAFEEEGFLPVPCDSIDDAMSKMQFTPYAAVVLHTSFEGGSLESNTFHTFMRNMVMNRRRNIHYTLIGPEFQTLYDLQALSYSANLVVNDNELENFKIILKKSLHESQKLFGPLADAMVRQGRITGSIWLDIKVKAEQKMKSAVLKDLLEVKE